MPNFAITTHKTIIAKYGEVVDSIETYLETLDNAITIYKIDISRIGGSYQGSVIHSDA